MTELPVRFLICFIPQKNGRPVSYETTPAEYELDLEFHRVIHGVEKMRIESHAPGSLYGNPVVLPFNLLPENPFSDRTACREFRDWREGIDDIKTRNKMNFGREQ